MRQGRTTFMKLDAGARDDSRSRMDMNRSTKGSRGRLSARPSRLLCRLIGAAGLACLAAAPGCSEEFDTSRQLPPRGTVGEEVYGVLCDRVAAQALREDLTGASFRDICHKPRNGDYANEVDASKLPSVSAEATDVEGNVVSVDKQRADRARAVGRVEALARRRPDLIAALDAAFPEKNVPIKDLSNPDPKKSCGAPQASGEGKLPTQLADMLGRFTDLYNDGTIPYSTQSLARVIEEFRKSNEAQAAWSRLSARQGYRPIGTALGAARPVLAYPKLRDMANATLALMSADSKPYALDAQRDADGNRVAVPGPANGAFNKMLEAAREELLTAKADPARPPLTVSVDPMNGRVVLSRPRENLEALETVMFASDPAFGSGDARWIVKRDRRGYAAIAGGAVPAPFVDADNDGLPDVDDLGRFKTTDGSLAPSPFFYPGAVDAQRDAAQRALVGGNKLLYDYVDTSHTFAAQMLADARVLADPAPEKEALMGTLGGMNIMLGPRGSAEKRYDTGKTVRYDGIQISQSPMLDLVYAMGVILADRNTDALLQMTKELFAKNEQLLARNVGAMLVAKDIGNKHPEASIPRESSFWDEQLDALGKIAKEPGLLEDVLRAVAAPESRDLGNIYARYAKYKDEISYDPNDINGPAFNLTTGNKSEMRTPVDRAQPQTGKNRSALSRFIGLISDTTGVTACNKPGAKVHAKLFGISATMPPSCAINSNCAGYQECEVFKIENLAGFYLQSIVNAAQYEPSSKPNKRGTFYLRDNLLRTGIVGIGAATVDLMQDSSGIEGFWTAGGSTTLAAKPEFLNRLVFFDLKNDSPTAGGKNYKTNLFIRDLQGEHIGSSVCPERTINDPVPGAPDAAPDGKVRGLRNCAEGEWIDQRGYGTIFTWENFGFYRAMTPLLAAFVSHNREDLFLELANAAAKHWAGKDASQSECKIQGGKPCARSGLVTYEELISEALVGDVLPAASELMKVLDTLAIPQCEAVDPQTKLCTRTKTVSGIDVAAAATRAALDPDYAKNTLKLKDRQGVVTAKRNDGSTNPQVTPAYLLTQALNGVDDAFAAYEAQHPEEKRLESWRKARSQLVDQFMGVSGKAASAQFTNKGLPKITPVAIDMLRGQLYAHCPKSFEPPYEPCAWATKELTQKAEETMGGPLFATGIDMMDAIRKDDEGRRQLGLMMQYLLDEASSNEALASMLASANDMIQLLRDDANLVPFYKVLAAAMGASKKDERGVIVEKSMVDAQMSLLAKVSGRYFDAEGTEICSREIDPNQVLAVALGNLVTPMEKGKLKGQTPLDVIIDVVADVNRIDPTRPYEGTLAKSDYGNVSREIVEFLTDRERGLEQFYEVIRQGTAAVSDGEE